MSSTEKSPDYFIYLFLIKTSSMEPSWMDESALTSNDKQKVSELCAGSG